MRQTTAGDDGEETRMPGTTLVARRHVDLLRTASAQCRGEELRAR
jgi:hypothetical protein